LRVLFVGDDWAEDHHDVEIVDEQGRRLARRRVPEGLDGVTRLHALIAQFVPDEWGGLDPADAASRVKVGIETDRGQWVQALIAAGYEVFALNPMSVARYRERHSTSGAKSDAGDAHVLAEIVRLDRSHHRPVAGTPHCPAMPAAFDTIQRPDRLVQNPALDTFTADIERREQWAMRRIAGPDRDGKERYECPARAGKLRCPLQPGSLALPLATPTVLTPPDPDTAPTCCTQRTVTVPGDVDAKARQRHYWGSPNWIKAFNRRSRVEGWFGNLKNDSTEALGRGAFRVMGICKTSIMVAVFAAATNLRLLRAWAKRTLGSDDLIPLLGAETQPSTDGGTPHTDRAGTGPPARR
jgi:Transposase